MGNNFDKFINKKLGNRAFEMKPAYWEQAQQMILADEAAKRRRRMIWWVFGVGLLLVSALAFYVVQKGSNQVSDKDIQSSINKIEQSTINNTAVIDTKEEGTSNSNATQENNAVEIPTAKAKEKKDTELPSNANNYTKKQNNQSVKQNNNPIRTAPSNSIKSTVEPRMIPSAEGKNIEKLIRKVESANRVISERSSSNNSVIEKITVAEKREKEIIPNTADEVVTSLALLTKVEQLSIEPIYQSSWTTPEIDLGPIEHPAKINNAASPWRYGLEATFTFNNIKTIEEPEFSQGQELFPNIQTSSNSIFYQVGIGGFVECKVGHSVYLGSGLNYKYHQLANTGASLQESNRYSFGLNTNLTLIQYTNLHTVELPLFIGVERKRHKLFAGVSMNAVIAATATKLESNWSTLSPVPLDNAFSASPERSTSVKNEFVEMNRIGFIGQLGYGFKLTNRLTIEGRMQYNLREHLPLTGTQSGSLSNRMEGDSSVDPLIGTSNYNIVEQRKRSRFGFGIGLKFTI